MDPKLLPFLAFDYEEATPETPVATRVARAWAAEKHFAMLSNLAKAEKNLLLPAMRDGLLEQGITDAIKISIHGTVGVSAKPCTVTRVSAKAEAVETGAYAAAMRAAGFGDLIQQTTFHTRLVKWYEAEVEAKRLIPEDVLKVINVLSEDTMNLRKVTVRPVDLDEDEEGNPEGVPRSRDEGDAS